MAIRVWPAGPQKKRGASQDSELAGPRGLGPQARIKLKKKTCTCVY